MAARIDRAQMMSDVGLAVAGELAKLASLSPQELRDNRRQKFLDMGRSGIVWRTAPWQCLYFLPDPHGHVTRYLPHVAGLFIESTC